MAGPIKNKMIAKTRPPPQPKFIIAYLSSIYHQLLVRFCDSILTDFLPLDFFHIFAVCDFFK